MPLKYNYLKFSKNSEFLPEEYSAEKPPEVIGDRGKFGLAFAIAQLSRIYSVWTTLIVLLLGL